MYDKITEILHQEGRSPVNAIVKRDSNRIVREGSTNNVLWTFRLVKINERDQMLNNFCKQQDLEEVDTWFKKRKTQLYRWKSPEYRKRYKVNYILVKQE